MNAHWYANPYTDKSFFSFIFTFFARLWDFLHGKFTIEQLASDEIQIIVLIGVAASSALVGTFLVLRRMTMLANSLSHTILIGLVIAFLLTQAGWADAHHSYAIDIQVMILAALIMGILTTFLTEMFTKWGGLQEDASTGIVFTSMFSIGVIAVTLLTKNAHIGTEVVMGNVDALQFSDCKLVYVILFINAMLFTLFFKEFKVTAFDAGLAKALGISPSFFNYLLMVLVSATAIGAFRAVGVLVVLAFMTGPALTAKLWTSDLKKMLLCAVALGCMASFIGVALSRHVLSYYGVALSTAGVIVCVIMAFYAVAALVQIMQHNCKSLRENIKGPKKSFSIE